MAPRDIDPAANLVDACFLSHGNWDETERAVRSVLGFGLTAHLGVTVDDTRPLRTETSRHTASHGPITSQMPEMTCWGRYSPSPTTFYGWTAMRSC